MNSDDPANDAAAQVPTAPVQFKRKKKLIDKPLQLKLIGVFVAIGMTCALFQIVLVNFGLLEVAKAAPTGGEEILARARGMMFNNVLWTIGALVPLMTCVGLILTHRVAGPAYRMTQHCRAIAEGGPVRPCKIRQDDELQELCNAMNAAFERVTAGAPQAAEQGDAWSLDETPSIVRAANGHAPAASTEPAA